MGKAIRMTTAAAIAAILLLAPASVFAVGKQLVGQKPPELQVKEWLNTEESYTFAKLKGKIVLIDFWATWCKPCVRAMPHLQKVWEKYKDKGLVVVAISAESKGKVEPFIGRYKYTFPFALDDNRKTNKSFGIRSIPTTYIVAPNGKVAWQGHATSKDIEKTIEALLPKVKMGESGGPSLPKENPTSLTLKEDLSERLQLAGKKTLKGDLGGALRIAKTVLKDDGASDSEKGDAKYVKEEIEKRAKDLFSEVEGLLKEKLAYNAVELLKKIRRAFAGSDRAKKAQEKIKAIEEESEFSDELKAGKLFAKGLYHESKGKKSNARKYFEQVVRDYPDTECAKRAKEKLK